MGAVLFAVIALFAILFTFWQIAGLKRTAAQALTDLRAKMDGSVRDILLYTAVCVTHDFATPEEITEANVDEWMRRCKLSEASVVNRQGVVLKTRNSGRRVGESFFKGGDPYAGFYRALQKGDMRRVSEPPRYPADGSLNLRYYAGEAFPDTNGFVQIAVDSSFVIANVKRYYATLDVIWRAGDNGFVIAADPMTGEIVTGEYGRQGKTLADFGLEKRVDEEGFYFQVIGDYGTCVCKTEVIGGLRMTAVLPIFWFDIYSDWAVVMFIAMLFVVALVASILGLKVIHAREKTIELSDRLAKLLAGQKRRLQAELSLAQTVQLSSLPKPGFSFPGSERFDLAVALRPAKEVGGDFYDFYPLGNGKLAIIVADVSGHGVPAAMFMMRAKTELKDELQLTSSLTDAMNAVNVRICSRNSAKLFITAWVGVCDINTGEIEFVNAGHNPPAVRRLDGSIEWMNMKSGPLMGFKKDMAFRSGKMTLKPGDMLFLYTDGVTEARSAGGEMFREERLKAALEALATSGDEKSCGPRAVERVLTAVSEFSGEAEQADDITLLAFVYLGGAKEFTCDRAGLIGAKNHLKECGASVKARIVSDEIVSNVVRESGATGFSLGYARTNEGEKLVFSDNGVAFDPLKKKDFDVKTGVKDRTKGGIGIFTAKNLSKKMEYMRQGGNNLLMILI